MKALIVKACIAILRKLNVSVLIGYEIHGDMRAMNSWSRTYDNKLNGTYRLANGERFDIPEGKFTYIVEKKK